MEGGGGSVQSFELSQKDSELTTPDLMVFKVTWYLRTVKNKIVLKINVGRASPETCMVGSAKIKECYWQLENVQERFRMENAWHIRAFSDSSSISFHPQNPKTMLMFLALIIYNGFSFFHTAISEPKISFEIHFFTAQHIHLWALSIHTIKDRDTNPSQWSV